MTKIRFSWVVFLLSAGPAFAAPPAPAPASGPVGEWLVEDGVARVRVVDCNSHLWGVISWEKKPGGVDAENPDKSKRTRPTLGIPILLDMTKSPSGDQWVGKVYNAQNGKLYDAKIRPLGPDQLELKGCVLGFLCGGQTWTRYVDPAAPAVPAGSVPPSAGGVKSKTAKPVVAPPPDPAADICSLPDVTGAAH